MIERKTDLDAEVIVAGAGPAGASAAYHLARLGRRVLLLDRNSFPRDKSCGDGLTSPAVRLLDEMGVLQKLKAAHCVVGARVAMRARGTRDFRYPRGADGLVVPRLILDDAIRNRAVSAGAEFWSKTTARRTIRTDEGEVAGVEIARGGQMRPLRARVVVAADGAASRLRHEIDPVPNGGYGFAIRGYFDNVTKLPDLLELYMPLRDVTNRYLLPSYGWVFPVAPTVANVGVGLFERAHGASVRSLFERFLDELRSGDGRFANARLCGAPRGAPLRFDFAPERAYVPGLVFVGDAAGLVSPFTGEGISYALESGKLAAEAIDRAMTRGGELDLREYELLLERRFAGYFEAGRRGARRYRMVWRLLDSTFNNEKPLFRICRRAVLFPEGVGDLRASDVVDDVDALVARGHVRVREDLLAVGEVLSATVRRDWPFLARFTASGHGNPGVPFRPALLLLLASYFGDPRSAMLIETAAAIELGYAAALAHVSVEDENHNADAHHPNLGNMLSVMVGDYLLSKASDLTASVSAGVTQTIARVLSRVAEMRARELRMRYVRRIADGDYLNLLGEKIATLFALPCSLGASLGGAPPNAINALERYGKHVGIAYALTDEVLEIRDKASELGVAVNPDLSQGGYSLPVVKALRKRRDASPLRELLRRRAMSLEEIASIRRIVDQSGATAEVMAMAEQASEDARAALAVLPNDSVRQTLERLARYAVTRRVT